MARVSVITILALAIYFTVGHAGRELREETGPSASAPHTTQNLSTAPSPNGGGGSGSGGPYVTDFGTIIGPHPARKINSSIWWGLLPPGWPRPVIPKFTWPWWFPRRPDWPLWFPHHQGWLPWLRRPFHDHLPWIEVAPGPRGPAFILP